MVLLITFGSLAAAGLPLLTALLGVGVSMVSIDYSLFVVSRYREERARGYDAREAAGMAAGTAGSAVVFAGLTVVIALAGLSVIGVPMLTTMGLGAAGAVLTGVLIALTMVPALLGFWPDAALARRVRKGSARVRQGRTLSVAARRATLVW